MKFAHMADCHIGSWRDPKLREVSWKAFAKAIDLCVNKEVDFILIAGDLFNTAIPPIDVLKLTVEKLKELKDHSIPVYMIAGSHDFSPSGKTMLDVLEKAELVVNVAKGEVVGNKLRLNFTIDPKTGAKITGLLGKRGGLERAYYENLTKDHLEQEKGYKIFVFHSALTEFKPEELKDIDSHPLSLLPKNFNYYAGGHVHYRFQKNEQGYGLISYPGPLFPNSFKELEDLERGGLNIIEVDGTETKIEQHPIQIYNLHKIKIDAASKTPAQISEEINKEMQGKSFNNTIITLRIEGTLLSGKVIDVPFNDIFERLYSKSAHFVMKNTTKLTTKEFEERKVETAAVDDIESRMIKEHLGQIKVKNLTPEKEENFIKGLLKVLSDEKVEGEKVLDFEKRIQQEAEEIITNNGASKIAH